MTRPALRLLPFLATTGIGSLPHPSPEAALELAFRHDLPFLPQLPCRDPAEGMIASGLESVPGVGAAGTIDAEVWRQERHRFAAALQARDLSSFEPSPQSCSSFGPFLAQLGRRKPPFAKVQLTGPATLRWAAKLSTGEPASAIAELDQQLFHLVLARALALSKAVAGAGATPILFLDEPGLVALRLGDARHQLVLQELNLLIASLKATGAVVGLHCCGNTAWRAVLGLGLDILSIDARLSLDAVVDERAAYRAFLASGARLALGLVPTELGAKYVLPELVDSIEASLRATIPSGLRFEALLGQMILTPACGLGMRSQADADRIVGELNEAQRGLRALS